jgi:hypothetical protein
MKKTLIITGASSGIGLAIAKRFQSANYAVHNLDITYGHLGHYHPCDVTKHEQVRACVESIAADYSIDVVISNAGMHFSGNIEKTSESDFTKVINLNVKGAYLLTQAVLPHMKQRQNGVILYIGSDQSTIGKSNSFIYNLSKHALASMAKTTALDYASYNIRANTLCPGTIETPLYHNAIAAYCKRSGADLAVVHAQEAALQPLGRIGQPEDVAAMALFLASDDAAFITGSLQAIDGGYTTG